MASLFTRLIAGEIPCHRIAEDGIGESIVVVGIQRAEPDLALGALRLEERAVASLAFVWIPQVALARY
jgi:hypothetical protein